MIFPRWLLLVCLMVSASFAAEPQALIEEKLDTARREVAADPQNGDAHIRLAIALGEMTDFTDNRTKMSFARTIREEAETGLRRNPRNSDGCLVLGKWHDEMTRLNPVLKTLATVIYGKLPASSFAEAEFYLRRAASVAPKQIRPHAELALFLERQHRPVEARTEWETVLALTPVDAEDRAFTVLARKAVR